MHIHMDAVHYHHTQIFLEAAFLDEDISRMHIYSLMDEAPKAPPSLKRLCGFYYLFERYDYKTTLDGGSEKFWPQMTGSGYPSDCAKYYLGLTDRIWAARDHDHGLVVWLVG